MSNSRRARETLRSFAKPVRPFVACLVTAVLASASPTAISRAEEPTAAVLLIVPARADFAQVEIARAAVADSKTSLLVGASPRIPLSGGLVLVPDRTFEDAPAADLVVVLAGDAETGLEEFLRSRRAGARAIVFLGDSPLLARLAAGKERGAALLLGKPESLRALIGGTPPPAPSVPTSQAGATATPARAPAEVTPTPTPTSGKTRVFDRYFSRGASPTPTPK
jgi:hypothetical protein